MGNESRPQDEALRGMEPRGQRHQQRPPFQGDVVALIDADGTQVVEYGYDAWGNLISKSGSLAATIGTLNPFRYRGYVYDEGSNMYVSPTNRKNRTNYN